MLQSRFLFLSESEQSAGESPWRRPGLDWVSIALGGLGFALSVWAFVEHIFAKGGQAGNLSCDVNAVVSCSNILTSPYGEIAGIPLGAFGMAFWAGVVVLGFLPRLADVSSRFLASWRLFAASAGFITALALAYIAYVVLKGVCPICSAVQLTCLGYFAYAVVVFLRVRREAGGADGNAFMRLVSTGLMATVPCLIVGFIVPPIAIDSLKKDQVAEAAKVQPVNPAETPIPAELLAVSKSNFVGKGEDYRMGSDDARVIIQVFTDPECPHCKNAGKAIDQAINTVGLDKVLYVARFYPLDSSCNSKSGMVHPKACQMALAARCAGTQGKFFEFLHWFYDGQSLSEAEKAVNYSDGGLEKKAAGLGLNVAAFKQCMESKVELPKIQADIELGTKLGLTGTPLVILNGRRFQGNFTDPAVISAALRAQLER